jgi:hypothetical protein
MNDLRLRAWLGCAANAFHLFGKLADMVYSVSDFYMAFVMVDTFADLNLAKAVGDGNIPAVWDSE